jgi:hypothetical protein
MNKIGITQVSQKREQGRSFSITSTEDPKFY